MSRHTTAPLPNSVTYDDCLISSCLKKMFESPAKKANEPVVVIKHHIADVKCELALLNKKGITELSYDYLASQERSVAATGFRYVVVYERSEPVLFTCFQLFTLTSKNFNFEKKNSFVKGLLSLFLDVKKIKVLISGNALRNETECCCYDEAVLNGDDAAKFLASVAEKIAYDECLTAVILKDMPGATSSEKWLSGLGYQSPWEDKVMAMNIAPQWQNLAAYIADLSRKYKTRANKILAAGSTVTTQSLSVNEIEQYSKDIDRLFKNVTDNQSFIMAKPSRGHFAGLKKLYKDNFEFTALFLGGRMAAFYSAFITGDGYEVYYVGLDYSLNNEYQLYFNILFASLERAIQLGKIQLKLGRTSFDAKASLGAKPVDMPYFIKTVNLPNVVNKWFAKYFSAMEDAKWKLRNPLKQA